jgi:hypothetical protein
MTINAKCAILDDLVNLEKKGFPLAQTIIVAKHGISAKNISVWSSTRELLFHAREQGLGHYRSLVMASRVQFPDQEDKLYIAFCARRQQGLEVPDSWFQTNMLVILAADKPAATSPNYSWENFQASAGWLWRYKKRYRISIQCQTNKKNKSIHEKLPLIKKFHKWLLLVLQMSAPQRCPKYGRFPAFLMFHMDQIPIAFDVGSKRTNNGMGSVCFIRRVLGSGLDKRQATLQLCIRADGEQVVRLAIIFRGQGNVLDEEEMKLYQSLRHLITVYFQHNAWADVFVMLEWLKQFHCDTAGVGEEVLLGMDNHGAQQTCKFRQAAKAGKTCLAYTPPVCTDCISPCDHHVGAHLKVLIKSLFQEEMENTLHNVKLSASQRRMMMAIWAASAWAGLRTQTNLLRSAFVSTGFLIAKSGEDHLIKIPGVPNYGFRT